MPSIDILLAFFVATALFAYLPGPAMLYAAAQTIACGKRGGFLAAFGIHIGGYIHVFAAAAGLAAVFHVVPVLYTALKLIGAAYLVYLGVRMIMARKNENTGLHSDIQLSVKKSDRRAFFDSVLVEVLNPKTALFFVAFLPQFVDPAAAFPVWVQLLVLGSIVNMMFSSADITCVLLAGSITNRLNKSKNGQKFIKAIGGSVLIGLGTKMALQSD